MLPITRKADAEIQREVLEELKWDPRVHETEVGVQVRGGIVTLTGTIDSYAKKVAAREAAHRVNGVLDVADDLEVKPAGVMMRSDAEIAKAVRQALEWDVLVPETRIRSTVTHGWVTLEGEVDSWAQRGDAACAVERLSGVCGVTNKIAVNPRSVKADEIRASIEEALRRQAQREAKRLNITVGDGIVTLSGTVRSWTEKNAIDRVAGFTRGVRRVDDKLVVDPYA